jgi:hypothetical protein
MKRTQQLLILAPMKRTDKTDKRKDGNLAESHSEEKNNLENPAQK